MRPIIVCGRRIENLPKEADYRFCAKLRQRQARNLLRDVHRSERVKKQVVQFRLSLLEKKLAQIENAFRRGLGVLDFAMVGETTRKFGLFLWIFSDFSRADFTCVQKKAGVLPRKNFSF